MNERVRPDQTVITDIVVRCSCGKEAKLFWSELKGHWYSYDETWRHTDRQGWTCGAKGHRQTSKH